MEFGCDVRPVLMVSGMNCLELSQKREGDFSQGSHKIYLRMTTIKCYTVKSSIKTPFPSDIKPPLKNLLPF